MIYCLRDGLDGLIDSEKRSLRPVGSSAREVAAHTGRLLAGLSSTPGVRVCAGIRVGGKHPPIGFAIIAGLRVLLIESVAWPTGDYSTAPDGRVLCDGIYIGQSVRPLVGSLRHLRRALPRHRRVRAAVVVHPYGDGPVALPDSPLIWLHSTDAAEHLDILLRPAGRRSAITTPTCGRT